MDQSVAAMIRLQQEQLEKELNAAIVCAYNVHDALRRLTDLPLSSEVMIAASEILNAVRLTDRVREEKMPIITDYLRAKEL